jgi:hypothetical protein
MKLDSGAGPWSPTPNAAITSVAERRDGVSSGRTIAGCGWAAGTYG